MTLSGGSTYWLVHAPPSGVEVGWGVNASGAIIDGAYTLTGAAPWTTGFDVAVAFRIEGTAVVVPEPTTAWLLGAGLVALGVRRRLP